MSKTINKKQSELLLSKMVSNPSIATNYTKQNRYEVAAFWKELHDLLNTAGPPMKTVFEWKKVWNDQKRYVRKKCAQNMQQLKQTGGGPNKAVPLTASEEAILQILGGNEAVEGVGDGNEFGFLTEFDQILTDSCTPCPASVSCSNATSFPTASSIQCSNATPSPTPSAVFSPLPKRKKFDEISNVVQKEIENQEKLCCLVEEGVAQIKKHNKEITQMMKRMYRALERANDLKKQELDEQVRHNKMMEQQNCFKIEQKLEINKRILEIEDLKLKKASVQNV